MKLAAYDVVPKIPLLTDFKTHAFFIWKLYFLNEQAQYFAVTHLVI